MLPAPMANQDRLMMTSRIAMIALICMGASGLTLAQTTPSQDSSSSSSSQRTPTEAPTTDSSASNPASASSPHQRQAMAKGSSDKMMKDCVAKQRAQNSGVSKKDATNTCKEQMKSTSEPTNR